MSPDDRQWLGDRFDQLDHRLDRISARKIELEKRVRALEVARGVLVGATAVITAALGWLMKVLHQG